MNDPIPYGRQWIDDDDVAAVERVLRSDWLTQGPEVEAFERTLAERCGARFAVACSSGTAALHLACLAAGLGPKDEVVVPPMTFASTANCALYVGATPVFADVQPDTLNLDPDALTAAVTDRTRAVICVHFAGHPCDMDEIAAVARDRGLKVVEDACHALGATYHGQKTGACARSDMAVFSFHPVKHVATGEGGAVLTNDEGLAERLRTFRTHGITKDPEALTDIDTELDGAWYYEMQELGFNYRITDFQCALGRSQMAKLDGFLARRREIAALYGELLADVPGLTLPAVRDRVDHAWHIYPVRVSDPAGAPTGVGVPAGDAKRRRAVFDRLRDRGILTQVHYIPVHLHPYYRRLLGTGPGDFPVAEAYYAGALTLPLFPKMTDADVERVAGTLGECLDDV
jgi:perosamine synthetase